MGKTIKLDEVPKLNHVVMGVVKSSMKKAARELSELTPNQIEAFDTFLDGLNDFEMQCFVNEVSTDSNGETSKFKMDVLMKYINCPLLKPDESFYETESVTIPINGGTDNMYIGEIELRKLGVITDSDDGISYDKDGLINYALDNVIVQFAGMPQGVSFSKKYGKFENGCISSYNILTKLIKKNRSTGITDKIDITHEEASKLIRLYNRDYNIEAFDMTPISSDIFVSKTVPLENVGISISYDYELPNGKNYKIDTYSVINIRRDYASRIKQKIPFGTLTQTVFVGKSYMTSIYLLGCGDEDNYVEMFSLRLFFCHDPKFGTDVLGYFDKLGIPDDRQLKSIANKTLAVWYGSQVALLHPQVKEIIKSTSSPTSKEPIELAEDAGMVTKPKKAKYVRHHVVDNNAYDRILYGVHDNEGNKAIYKRHTLSWYVIGHWRNYENGKRIFIQPHWRGPLRQIQQHTQQPKARVFDETVSE